MHKTVDVQQPFSLERHISYPLMLFLLVAAIFEYFQFDLNIAQYFFSLEGGVDSWPLRGQWLSENVLHTGGRNLVIVLGTALLISLGLSCKSKRWNQYRRNLLCLTLSVLTSILLVKFAKEFTHVSCPWDVIQFGGQFAYVPIFSPLPNGAEFGQCFPGGHSSGGYAWVALYYFALQLKPKLRWYGLAFGILLGATFSLTQQLRGAHFFSHGLWSLAISWFTASSYYYFLFVRAKKQNRLVIPEMTSH
ncbi:phosphatase PAP2 family protein [Shewanella sp. GutCb]|uniref:phosphatase PAP2 family protein n=1 Tax=Shewanella sp. GutCb TaxID=2058315 RepID=UPI00215560C8|nr:phosphatase PAP2 family protein [Shewanella sp. GutCb]